MLPNTTTIPETDARLGADLIQAAINDLDVIVLIVVGKDDLAKQTVEWADKLANRLKRPDGSRVRRVVWVRFADRERTPAAIRTVLNPILGDPYPLATILNLHDKVMGSLSANDEIRPLTLEQLFVKGNAA